VEIVKAPRLEMLPERAYLGIRVVTPFRGMLGVGDDLLRELRAWVAKSDAEPVGYGFLRLYVVDMQGPMDIEVGIITHTTYAGDGRVEPGVLPAGRYVTLTYRNHGVRANGALIDWAHDNGVAFDRRQVPEGDAFACRYEAFLTDPKQEPRKTRWEVEVSIKAVD
jgi:effector-binding domain-containing protein